MKYFIDTEFIEGFRKPLFGKKQHFIDLISIGIVAEDGREYYAISNEYNYNEASKWVKDNVILPMYRSQSPTQKQFNEPRNFHKHNGKSIKQISQEIFNFVNPELGWHISFYNNSELKKGNKHPLSVHFDKHNVTAINDVYVAQPEFIGYYADYDWVLFCSLWGTMMGLPPGFPMYCIDIKQMMIERGLSKEWKQKKLPDPEGEHNALVDAKWNMELYKLVIKSRRKLEKL